MTEKESRVEEYKLGVREAESDLRLARTDFEHGFRKIQADNSKAKSELERTMADGEKEYSRLKEATSKAEIELARQKVYLKEAETTLAQGFEV